MCMYLNRFLYPQCWYEDGQDEQGVLLDGAVFSHQQDQREDEGYHEGIAELGTQSWEDTLVDHTLWGGGCVCVRM